jgi:hypothetical protein
VIGISHDGGGLALIDINAIRDGMTGHAPTIKLDRSREADL